VFAVAAVIDIALNARGRPVDAKSLANRHCLPPRHLEPVLQALVRQGVLKGIRGPRGGYALARDARQITVDDIVRAVESVVEEEEVLPAKSALLSQVVMPALSQAETAFSAALSHINVRDLVGTAERIKKPLN
jgi:Rrf2 family protein